MVTPSLNESVAPSTRLHRLFWGFAIASVLWSLGWTIAPKGEDHMSFPASAPDREIDFIVYRPAEALDVIEHRLLDEPVMSDHRPLLATIRLR